MNARTRRRVLYAAAIGLNLAVIGLALTGLIGDLRDPAGDPLPWIAALAALVLYLIEQHRADRAERAHHRALDRGATAYWRGYRDARTGTRPAARMTTEEDTRP